MRCSFCIKELVLGYVNPSKDYKLCDTCAFRNTGHPHYSFSENKGDFMLENPSFSDLIDLICSFCNDPENITAYDRAVYDIHLKDECQQKLNEAIKNASNDVLIEVIKDGRSIPIHHHYCTYSEIFLLEDLAIEELTNRSIDPVTFESRSRSMDSNDIIRDAVKRTWWNYVLEPKDWREDFGLATQNLYDILFCPKNGLSAYSYDSDCLLMCDNAEYLRKIFNEVKKRLSSDIKDLINRGEKDNSVIISIVPADFLRFFNKDTIGKKKSLHIVYNGLDDYFYSDELEDLLKLTELKYFPVILSFWGRGKITNMIPCIKVSLNLL